MFELEERRENAWEFLWRRILERVGLVKETQMQMETATATEMDMYTYACAWLGE